MPDPIVTTEPSTAVLSVLLAGTVAYREGLVLQEQVHREVGLGLRGPTVLMLEHWPVVTLGKHANPNHLLWGADYFRQLGVEIEHTDRGGEVTAHMPGQLVIYPILPLAVLGLGVRAYVGALEDAVIETLAHYGVVAATDPINPGVWVGRDKICALGIRVKNRISMHGLALNVSNALTLFEHIVPCGLVGRGVISLQRLQPGLRVGVADVSACFIEKLASRLGLAPQGAVKVPASLQWRDGVFTI